MRLLGTVLNVGLGLVYDIEPPQIRDVATVEPSPTQRRGTVTESRRTSPRFGSTVRTLLAQRPSVRRETTRAPRELRCIAGLTPLMTVTVLVTTCSTLDTLMLTDTVVVLLTQSQWTYMLFFCTDHPVQMISSIKSLLSLLPATHTRAF